MTTKANNNNYPSFEVAKTIRVDDMMITPGYYTYTGRENGGKGVYLNVHTKQTLGFDLDMLKSLKEKHQNDIQILMKKGGRVKKGNYSYIPQEEIDYLVTEYGKKIDGNKLLDGAYAKGKIKSPKIIRTQFEEEDYEFATGGSVDEDVEEIFLTGNENWDEISSLFGIEDEEFSQKKIENGKQLLKISDDFGWDYLILLKNRKIAFPDRNSGVTYVTEKPIKNVDEFVIKFKNCFDESYAEGGSMDATGGEISVYNLRKGDKVRTRKGDIETIIKKTGSGSYETIENDYSHSPESLEFVSRPGQRFSNESKSSKSDIITNFIKTYTEDDDLELLDIEGEISDIQKMVRTMGKGAFVKKLSFEYNKAEKSDIEDFFDSIKFEEEDYEFGKGGQIDESALNEILKWMTSSHLFDENPENGAPISDSKFKKISKQIYSEWDASKDNYNDIQEYFNQLEENGDYQIFLFEKGGKVDDVQAWIRYEGYSDEQIESVFDGLEVAGYNFPKDFKIYEKSNQEKFTQKVWSRCTSMSTNIRIETLPGDLTRKDVGTIIYGMIMTASTQYGMGGDIKAFFAATKETLKKGYNKSKEYTKNKIHDTSKKIALDVIDNTKDKVRSNKDKMTLKGAEEIVTKKYADGGRVGKMYYHILEYGNYGNIGYHGYYENLQDAEKEVKRLEDFFPNLDFQIFTDKSRKEPPITTMAKGGNMFVSYAPDPKNWLNSEIIKKNKRFTFDVLFKDKKTGKETMQSFSVIAPNKKQAEENVLFDLKEDFPMVQLISCELKTEMAKGGYLEGREEYEGYQYQIWYNQNKRMYSVSDNLDIFKGDNEYFKKYDQAKEHAEISIRSMLIENEEMSKGGYFFLNESKSSKSDIITNFIKTYTEDDDLELLDMEGEISDIQKMVRTMGKGAFVKKLSFEYNKAEKSDIEDFFDSIKYENENEYANGGNLNKDVKLKFDLNAYPRTHHLSNQPKKIVIARGENIKVIEHPFEKQPNDSLIMYKDKEYVVVKSSLNEAIDGSMYKNGGKIDVKKTDGRFLNKISNRVNKVWDMIGADSGGQIRSDKEMLNNYASKSLIEIDKLGLKQNSLTEKDFSFYENKNDHLLNEFLIWNNFYTSKFAEKLKHNLVQNFKESPNAFSDPAIIKVVTDDDMYIPRSKIQSIKVRIDGKEVIIKGSDVLNGANR